MAQQRIDEKTEQAIRTHYIRLGGVTDVIPADHNSGTSTYTRHVTLTFNDGRVEHHKVLLQASTITDTIKVLSTRPYEPIDAVKVLDGTVTPPPVGRVSDNSKRESLKEKEVWFDLDNEDWTTDPQYGVVTH